MSYLQEYFRTSPSIASIPSTLYAEIDQKFIRHRDQFITDMHVERERLNDLGILPAHISAMLKLVSQSLWNIDLIAAYSKFSGTTTPYVVRYIQDILVRKYQRPVAYMMTQQHLDAYMALDTAFSGPATEFAHRRDTREGAEFEKDILFYLFDNFDDVENAAMLIDRRAVRNMDELKDALVAMRGVTLPLTNGAL